MHRLRLGHRDDRPSAVTTNSRSDGSTPRPPCAATGRLSPRLFVGLQGRRRKNAKRTDSASGLIQRLGEVVDQIFE
ncbi:MAG: hypothetical protein D6741_11750, partial [Planctomycetota bacterium]